MFTNLKKKIQESGTNATSVEKSVSNSSPAVAKTTLVSSSIVEESLGNSSRRSGSETAANDQPTDDATGRLAEDVLANEGSSSKEVLMELLVKRTKQVNLLESRVSEFTSLLKEKNHMIEKLEVALEKQQDVLCQRVQEVNEQYNNYRVKTADIVAAAVKKKEEEMKMQLKEMEKKNAEVETKVLELERCRERLAERQENKDELDAFATQELTKVKHLLLKAQEELERMKSEKWGSAENDGSSDSDVINRLEKQLFEMRNNRSELEVKNAQLSSQVLQLQSDLCNSKEALQKLNSSQEDWLEKQIETEKCISDLEDRIQSLKAELAQRDMDRSTVVKQLSDQLTELNATKSQLKLEQERTRSLQVVVDSHETSTTCLQQRCDQSDAECQKLRSELSSVSATLESCQGDLQSCQGELKTAVDRGNLSVTELQNNVLELTNERAILQQQMNELEEKKAEELASAEADVTAKLRGEITLLEDQIQDKNRVIKKQDQRLSDLKKLLQRELKVLPCGADLTAAFTFDSSSVTSSGQPPVSVNCNNSNDNGVDDIVSAAAAVHIHTAALHRSPTDTHPSSSPATLSVSEVGSGRHRNGAVTHGVNATTGRSDVTGGGRTRRVSQRSLNGGGGAVMMSPVDSEYDFMRELNFKYLRHVVFKFMLSREAEALQLIKAVSMLLHFTPEEQNLIRDTLEWKKSWFGARPQLSAKGQQAKIVPPSY